MARDTPRRPPPEPPTAGGPTITAPGNGAVMYDVKFREPFNFRMHMMKTAEEMRGWLNRVKADRQQQITLEAARTYDKYFTDERDREQ